MKRSIVLNHMFSGTYINNSNIGHEIINLYASDSGENFIYLCAEGKFNDKEYFPEYSIQVYRPDNTQPGVLQVISIAKIEKYLVSLPHYDDLQENTTYGGVKVKDIFKQNSEQQEICLTFRAQWVIQPKQPLYIIQNTQDKYINGYNVQFNHSQTLREYFGEGSIEYCELKKLIEDVLTGVYNNPVIIPNAQELRLLSSWENDSNYLLIKDRYFNAIRSLQHSYDNNLVSATTYKGRCTSSVK